MTSSSVIERQRAYYAETSQRYDAMHDFDEHYVALWHVAGYLRALGATSVLDTGCGTGLAMRYLAEALPGIELRGNDPSAELLRVAVDRHGLDAAQLDCADSTVLPYEDGQFDAVVETAMLHHVPDPSAVIAEMLRVARRAVFFSDSNMYGLGGLVTGLVKLGLARAGLLRRINRVRRGGHDWYASEGDGIAWSYSVFDSLPQVREACPEVVVVPTRGRPAMAHAVPLLAAPTCLVAGFKDRLPVRASQAPQA